MTIPDHDLPPLPEPAHIGYTTKQLREAQRQAYAKGIADFLKQHEGEAVAYRIKTFKSVHKFVVRADVAEEEEHKLGQVYGPENIAVDALFLAPQPQEVEAAVMTDDQCDAIYNALDEWAREFDSHEFGLPQVCGGGVEGGRGIIRRAIRARTTSPETGK